jgi:hypothetical protein
MQKQQSICICPSFFLALKNAKNYSPEKSIALDSSQNWRRKRKKELLGQGVVFNLLMWHQ